MSALDRLTELVPPTAPASHATDAAVVARLLGDELPEDYLAFLATYGGGQLEGVVTIFDPASTSAATHPIRQLLVQLAGMNGGMKFVPFDPPFVPFGVASDGTVLYFVRRGRPSLWQVSTAQPGQSPEKFKAHDVSMTELVLGMVTGKIEIGTVKKPASPPRFVPAARAGDAKTKTKTPAEKTATKRKAAKKKAASKENGSR